MRTILFSVCICLIVLACSKPHEPDAIITVTINEEIGELKPIWNFFGYDEANYTFSPEGELLLSQISELSNEPAHIRCHHLLTSGDGSSWLKWSSTNAYTENAKGDPIYNWVIVDSIFDVFIKLGLKPYVQAGFMPEALSSEPKPYTPKKVLHERPVGMVSGGAFYPPKDYTKWYNFMKAWANHCIERYGKAEAESWYWEVWNEPNLGYWKGSTEEYFKLYDYTAKAIKEVLPQARMGGPHIASPGYKNGSEFLVRFLEHCFYETNFATGEVGSPLDFVATHAKGGTTWDEDHARMNLGTHLKQIDMAAEIMASYPESKNLPLIIGESDPDGCAGCTSRLYPQNSYRNGSHYASYTAATFMRKQDVAAKYGVNLEGAITWAFTFPGQAWFDGFRSLSTNGVVKPVFNTFRMFSRLQTKRVKLTSSSAVPLDSLIANGVSLKPDIDGIATKGDNKIAVLLWNYYDLGIDSITNTVQLNIRGFSDAEKTVSVEHYRIDKTHSNAYSEWLTLGSPQNPSKSEIELLKKASDLSLYAPIKTLKLKNGELVLNFDMPYQSVSLLKISW